jgi:hypothetical protein
MQASAWNSILYAVIDNAKYPLNCIDRDSFTNIQGIPFMPTIISIRSMPSFQFLNGLKAGTIAE